MKLSIELSDSDFTPGSARIRSIAAFLLHEIGDLDDNGDPTLARNADGSPVVVAPEFRNERNLDAFAANVLKDGPPAPPVPSAAPPPPPPPVDSTEGEDGDDGVHPPSNVTQLFPNGAPPPPPSVPPPPPVATAGASSSPPSPPATNAAAAGTVVSAEVDKAGMTWDERIHQKGKSKKKDGTWKLKKGIDVAIVQAVTAELAARKGAVAPVSLPGNTVPVPPVANGTAAPAVPAPPATPPVPVAGSPGSVLPGSGSASPYRILIDKITTATLGGKLTPAKVSEICQAHGAPNLMQLNSMPHLIELVSSSVDAAVLGLA